MELYFNTQVILDILDKIFRDSELTSKYQGMEYAPDTQQLKVIFSESLTKEEQDDVANIVSDHSNTYFSSFDFLLESLRKTQKENIAFGQKLLHDWMRKNTLEGMTIKQSLWVFSRFEEFEIACDFGYKKVDIFKMFNSGALPTAYFCILQVEPDPMTEDYHWLTQERIGWVKEQIEEFIGEGAAGYIPHLVSQSQ